MRHDYHLGKLPSKRDFIDVESELTKEIERIRLELKRDVEQLRAETQKEIELLRMETKRDIAEAKVDLIRWVAGIVGILQIVAISFLLLKLF